MLAREMSEGTGRVKREKPEIITTAHVVTTQLQKVGLAFRTVHLSALASIPCVSSWDVHSRRLALRIRCLTRARPHRSPGS